ncbi:MAG: hypothetical protein LiPW30_452 [Parcubacteria group bacterium LiPW_30]|nr:MAG: hypothetical protein LiPW30_452 [Parcubacteria group bacterium LiPW_30]
MNYEENNYMSSNIIKQHLAEMVKDKKLDAEFIQLLSGSNDNNEEGRDTAIKILFAIKKRYVESKKDNS